MRRDSFGIKWEAEDFTKCGYIATYVIGECRCEKCVERWESWFPSKTAEIHKIRRKVMKS